jgi:hypothetical protein
MNGNKQEEWYKAIKKELVSRDNECQLRFGSSYEYARPAVNPYLYHDVEAFKKNNKFKATPKYCHYKKSRVEGTKDADERFYVRPKNQTQCANLRGIWRPNDINRVNKYDHGVCWTDAEDAHCGSRQDSGLLRPKVLRAKDAQIEQRIEKTSTACNADPACAWVKTGKYSYDCFAKKRVKSKQGKVETPPDNMPDFDLESYIYEWYKNNRPSHAPKVNELIGEGNRCVPQAAKDGDAANTTSSLSRMDFQSIRQNLITLDPLNRDHQWYYEKFLGEEDAKTLRREYRFNIETQHYVKNHFMTDDEKRILKEALVNKTLDKRRIEHIQSVLDESEEPAEEPIGFAPSIPQSVINMVMKNVSRKKTSQRGMLAWHSTGSGKCHAKDTPILMYDGTIMMVQDIRIGDRVMGDDSRPRKVLDLGHGFDMLYDIIDINSGDSYRVNSEHILCLKDITKEEIIEISVNEFLALPEETQQKLKGYRVPVEFPYTPCLIDPYYEGYNAALTAAVPNVYKVNASKVRMKYLAGVLDRWAIFENSTYVLTSLSPDIVFLARTLGLHVHKNTLSGYVPCRKHPVAHEQPLTYDIMVKASAPDFYFGFMLDSNQRYLLADCTMTHNTCTAMGVIDSFWDDPRDIIFASSLDALASNPDYKFHECALNLYPRFQRAPFTGKTREESMAIISEAFKKRNIRFMSFAQLSFRVKSTETYKTTGNKKEKPVSKMYVDLDKSVLIFDEVHNLFRPLQTQKRQHEYLESQLVDPTKFPNMKIVILTATPGDNIPDVVKLLNIIRDPSKSPITAPVDNTETALMTFKKSVRNMISFFDMSSDLTKFPKLLDEFPVRVPMGKRQFDAYLEAYNDVAPHARNFAALAKENQTNKYWAAARRYANMLYTFEPSLSLSEFSNKMPALLDTIKKAPNEKHYVYSAFFENRGYGGHGIIAVAKELDKMGYVKLTVAEAKALNKKGAFPSKQPRYILAITNEISPGKKDDSEKDVSAGKNLHEMIKIYNSAANKNGEYVHVFLASQGFNEGIDLKGVRNIHIFEPLVTWASDKQTLGRAVRYCSHADLDRDKGEWVVRVYRYMSEMPLDIYKGVNDKQEQYKQSVTNDISAAEARLGTLDKKTQKAEIASTKAIITEKKKELKAIEKELRANKKIDINNISNIEEVIHAEAKERMMALINIYQAMKEAAVDCRIMREFHKSTCADFAAVQQ